MRRAALVLLCAAVILALPAAAFGKLSDEQFEDLKKRINSGVSRDPTSVTTEITDIARDDSRRAVEFLVNINRKALDNSDVVAVIQQALASMGSDEARSAIISNTPKAADYRMRIILIEVCQRFSGSEVTSAIIQCVDDRNDKVAMSAVRALGNRGSLEAVEPLVELMEKLAKKKEDGSRLYNDVRIALENITGQSDLIEAQDWRNWYNANKDKIVPGTPGADGRIDTYRPMVGEAKTVSFFGIQIDSRRIIFVIDVSGSMEIPDPPPENWVPDGDIDTGKGTTLGKDDPTLKKKIEDERKRMNDPKVWGEERKRIVRTKKELIRVLKALEGTVKFNIVAFSDEIRTFSKKLEKATSSTRDSAVKWVEKLAASGLTFTDDALREAFKDEEMDTIILLSDGAPTHMGGDAKPEWNGHQDSQMIIESIYGWLDKENKFRKVTIHTLGFTGANFEFMEELSKRTNGKFREIK
jgi:hypothetical protein